MADNIYQTITLSVNSTNPQAGDRITVTLGTRGGKDVAWSTGQNFATSAGINLTSTGTSSVPVSQFSITARVVTFLLAPSDSGGGVAFNLQAFLVAVSDISEFTLTLDTNQNSSVTATLSGRNPMTLDNDSPVTFDWTQQ